MKITWNVRGIYIMKEEMEQLDERKIDIAVLTETKKKGSETDEYGDFIRLYGGSE